MPYVVGRTKLVHICCARKQFLNIYTAHGRRKQTDGAKLAEPSANAVRHIEGIQSKLFCYFYQVALLAVGGGDDMPCPAIAELFPQYARYKQKLRHGFGRAAGFCDNVKGGALRVYDLKQRCHPLRINIVLNEESGAAPLILGQVVVAQAAQRLMHGGWTQRAAADTKYNEVVKAAAYFIRFGVYCSYYLALLKGQLTPFHAAALIVHALRCGLVILR